MESDQTDLQPASEARDESGFAPVAVGIPIALGVLNLIFYMVNENNWFYRRYCNGKFLCFLAVSNRAAHVGPLQRPTTYWAWDLIEPDGLTQGYLSWSPWALLVLRFSYATIVLGTTVLGAALYTDTILLSLTYFTIWTFLGWGIYGMLAGVLSFRHCRQLWNGSAKNAGAAVASHESGMMAGPNGDVTMNPSRGLGQPACEAYDSDSFAEAGPPAEQVNPSPAPVPNTCMAESPHDAIVVATDLPGSPQITCSTPALQQQIFRGDAVHAGIGAAPALPAGAPPQWTLLQKSVAVLLQVVTIASITLTVYYVSIIRGNLSLPHGGVALMLLVEVLLSRAPFVSYHVQATMIYGTIYLVVMWAYVAIDPSDFWMYESLNWHDPVSAAFYSVLPGLILISFFVCYFVARLRERWLSSYKGRNWCC